jgi:hypothetical protein
MKAASLLLQFSVPNAVYAVLFFVPASSPFHSLDLSYILLRFMNRYIHSGNYSHLNLVSLSYKLGPSGSFGILLFDNGLCIYADVPEGKKFSERFPPLLQLPDLHLAELGPSNVTHLK